MGGGRVCHVHTNKMRKFHVPMQSCNIISENDVDFGRVLVPMTVESDVLTSVNVDRSKIEHLNPEQQGELVALLEEFAACVSDEPVLYRVRKMWSLIVFLVCGILMLIMTVSCEIVKLTCLFGTVAVRGRGYLWRLFVEFILGIVRVYWVICCVRPYVSSQVVEIAEYVSLEYVYYLSLFCVLSNYLFSVRVRYGATVVRY